MLIFRLRENAGLQHQHALGGIVGETRLSADFDFLVETQSWAVQPGTRAVSPAVEALGSAYLPTAPFVAAFGELDRLLRLARATELESPSGQGFLIAWDNEYGEPIGWVSPPPLVTPAQSFHKVHRLLLESFGGIGERMNEPEDTWLLNLNSALTEKSSLGRNGWFDYYVGACEVHSRPILFDPDDFIPFALEANGNCTLYHRETATVIMEAHDHSFKHIEPLPGCPDYSLYSIVGCPDLSSWVRTIATQWLRHII